MTHELEELMSTTMKVAAAVAVTAAVVVGVWLIRPLFVDTVVDEEFPLSSGAAVPDDMTLEEVESEMAEAAATQTAAEDEPMPGTDGADGADAAEDADAAEEADAAEDAGAAAGGPVALVAGDFAGADDAHQGSGTATIYAVEGTNVLRLEDFQVTNGPDLHVYLTPIREDGQPDIDAGIDLGGLRGNIGNQNYDIPPDFDLDQPLAVVIWCQPFRVTFATATLT